MSSVFRLRLAHFAWLLIAAVGGTSQVIVVAPFQVPDEDVHWATAVSRTLRALRPSEPACDELLALSHHYGQSDLRFHPNQRILPSLYSDARALKPQCAEPSINYGFLFSYPSAVIVTLSRETLGIPVTATSAYFLGRLLSGFLVLSCAGIFVWLTTSKAQLSLVGVFAQSLILILCVSPIVIQQSFGISSDSVVYMFALLAAGLLLSTEVPRWIVPIYFVVGSMACITKPTLLPLLPAFWWWLRVHGRFGNSPSWFKSPRETEFFLVTASIVLLTLWTGMRATTSMIPHERANPALHLSWLLQNPIQGLWILLEPVGTRLVNFGGLKNPLGWNDHSASGFSHRTFQFASQALLVLSISSAWAGIRTLPPQKSPHRATMFVADLLLGFAMALSASLVSVFLFLNWTPAEELSVVGYQYRYIIPTLILMVAWLTQLVEKNSRMLWFSDTGKTRNSWLYRCLLGVTLFFALLYSCERTYDELTRYF